MKSGISSTFEAARRNCNLCFTYRTFRPRDEYKGAAYDACDRAYRELGEKFNEVRKDDASPQKLDAIRDAKALCLKAMDACESCTKESPRIKEILARVR